MRTLRSILVILSLVFSCVTSHAAPAEGYEIRKWSVKASQEMPKAGGPEARAIEFLNFIGERKYDQAKAYFSKELSKEDRDSWDRMNADFEMNHGSYKLFSWHIYKIENGFPVAKLVYETAKGRKPNFFIPMIQEDGKWMVAGR